jgi:hypothetical protein
MESSNPIIMIPNLFSEDYKHFESTCMHHPEKAEVVFGYVANLRAALQAFREATIGSNVDANDTTTASPETPEAAVLVASVEGSVEKDGSSEIVGEVITRADECCAKAVDVIG